MYPLAEPRIMYPVGAASHHSGLILAALKITRGGMVIPPALMYDTVVVFVGFSPLTVWKLHSPVTPTTVLGWGTSPTSHRQVFESPIVNPFFVFVEEMADLCWVG